LTGEAANQIVGTKKYHKALYDDQTYSIVDLLLGNVLTKRVQQHDSRTYRESSILEGAYETEIYFSNLGIDGKWLYGTAALLKTETGKTSGAIETWQDLTESKQLERQVIQSQKMEAIGTLAAGIAHDFNNILLAISGHAELALLESPKESTLNGNLKQIRSAGMRAEKLVLQILTFSRQAEVETEPIQVSAIVEETMRLIMPSLLPNIKVQQDIQSHAFVMADATHIHQVILNLCTNASHAMLDGGILGVRLVEVQIEEDQIRPDGYLMLGRFIKLTVSDTGQGIPLEVRDKILNPFYTTKRRGEGTGMGLSVTHGIIKQYDGVIDFDSEPGNGSTFHVFLPIVGHLS
jgi:signal transduction histidine kinase